MAPGELILNILATKRVTRLVVEDEITRPVRVWVEEHNEPMGYLVRCPACISFWAALLVLVLPRFLRVALAASEAVTMLSSVEANLMES